MHAVQPGYHFLLLNQQLKNNFRKYNTCVFREKCLDLLDC